MKPEEEIEKKVTDYLVSRGGQARKLQWIGRRGAPDKLFMINGHHFLVEFKAPGKKPSRQQQMQHEELTTIGGFRIYVIDDTCAGMELVNRYCSC